MGLLLGGSILTLFELLDLLIYNAAWKARHKVSSVNKLDTKTTMPSRSDSASDSDFIPTFRVACRNVNKF